MREWSGWDEKQSKRGGFIERDCLEQTHTHTHSWCWHFSVPISIAICFDVIFLLLLLLLLHPPIPFTKSSNFSFANTLIYEERVRATREKWWKKNSKSSWTNSNWSKHAHCTHTRTASTKANTDTFIATVIKLRRFVCHSHKEFIQYQVNVCVCAIFLFCVEMFSRFHFMKLNASNVAFVKWILFYRRCQFAASVAQAHIQQIKNKQAKLAFVFANTTSDTRQNGKKAHTHGQNETYYN